MAISEIILVVLGLGIGVSFPNLTTAIQNAVERADLGAATATAAFFRSLGGAVGVALSGAILTARLQILMPGGIRVLTVSGQMPIAEHEAVIVRLPARPFHNLSCGGDHRSDCVPHRGAVPRAAAWGYPARLAGIQFMKRFMISGMGFFL